MAGQPASMPLEPLPLPKDITRQGLRLDGRGYEEFRSVCKWGMGAWCGSTPPLSRRWPTWLLPRAAAAAAAAVARAVLDTGVITRAAGSAYIELGNTKVMAAV